MSMTSQEVEHEINILLHEKFFAGIKKYIVQKEKDRFVKTAEYSGSKDKKTILNKSYKTWFNSVSCFFLGYKSIYALQPLVARELKIREFSSEEVIRVKADYIYNGIEFSAYYPLHYNSSMSKEIEDCIAELKNPILEHSVSSYIERTNTERSPHEPLTTAELKYSSFYLFGFEPNYVTLLAELLYKANLITNPETNGWRVDDDIVDDIVVLLNDKYGADKVLQYKRVFTDKIVDREKQECIRPTNLKSDFFPKKINLTDNFQSIQFENDKEKEDAKKLYEFIFYITLSTQMRNSMYDTSSIEITVGDKILKEQAHVLLPGEDNWELLTGAVINSIANNESSYKKPTLVLPNIAQDTILMPLDIYSYSYNSKRPPRYGMGRFVTQILEKNSIGTNKEHDEIINELVNAKAIKLIKTMLHPQENAVILISWMAEYLPKLLDFEYKKELEEKIELVCTDDISLQSLLNEITRLIEDAFTQSGFVYSDEKPSPQKLAHVKKVAQKNNAALTEEILASSAKIDIFLAQFPEEQPIKIGSCPECNALVFQKEYVKPGTGEVLYYFSCENFSKGEEGCHFSIWDSFVHKFFSDKAIEFHTVKERANALTKILSKKKGYLFNGFIGQNSKPYDAKVFAESYMDRKTTKKKWGFSLEFSKQKR